MYTKDKNLEMFNKIKEYQYQISVIRAIRNEKRIKNIIDNECFSLEKYVSEQAQRYGQDSGESKKLLLVFRQQMDKINSIQEKFRKELVKEKEEIQEIANKEIFKLINNQNISGKSYINSKNKILKSRRISAELDRQIEQTTGGLKEVLQSIVNEKQLSLRLFEKQNPLQKLFEKILNKIKGNIKFKENVIMVLEQKIKNIEEQLPKVEEKMNEKAIQQISENINKIIDIENPKNKYDCFELAKKIVTSPAEEYKKIIIKNKINKYEGGL